MKKLFKILPILFFLLNSSCQNNDFDDALKLPEVIKKEDELFELIQYMTNDETDPTKSITCVKFIYPFQLFIYNQSMQIIDQKTLTSNAMFSNILENLPNNNFISISYPLQTTLQDGTIFTVNNNAELKLAIDACSKEDIIGNCGWSLAGNLIPCGWEVPFIDGQNNDFAGAVLTTNLDGTMELYHQNQIYYGTWSFLFIENNLFFNVNFSGISAVSTGWNFNYEILTMDENVIEIKANNIVKTLIKDCKDDEEYEIGDLGPNDGIIAYKKSEFSNGWQYIEVAPTDFPTEEWGCMNSNITNAQFSQIGTGLQNTYTNLNFHTNLNNYATNPSICSNQNNGTLISRTAKNAYIGVSHDWFIPSKNELQQIYSNLSPLNLGNFENANYWSSTESNTSNAVVINMQTGVESIVNKNSSQTKTRVIRYF
ncbi:DUF1566 domain-containing protein [Flavobacterium urocaniciphilum]|uniref:DUF1566 domain-containing protein n=1 Tax=Flavobacterium urocaniciphilum TaxID=1299341 RepID=A0A1H9APV7_9FLAO|nr:DUF1566 domain-containing protein [Flavobacterium urocaniciphilum]SEP78796.1 Protein of unknown function [Flavobacterium urocaniciphilum]